jgi:predicted ATPase
LHSQSHGESFLSLISNRFKGNGLYILDEPEAALSLSNQLKLLVYIDEFIKKDSQFIIATHSPIILGYPESTIYLLQDDSIQKVSYEETPHVQLTKYFVNNRDKMLKELLVGIGNRRGLLMVL